MKRDYKYAMYVLALATTVALAAGVLVVTGEPSTDDTRHAQLDDTDVELLGDQDALTAAERERLPHLVWENENVRSYFDEPDALTFEVSERTIYDEDAGEFVPADDAVRVQVSPADERLPYAFVMVDLDAETVTLETGFHSIDDIDIAFADESHRLTDDERTRLETVLLDDPDIEWDIKTLLDEPDALDASVVDREGDRVTVALTGSDGDSPAVRATVDLATETVDDRRVSGAITVHESDSISGTVDASPDRNGTYVLHQNQSESISVDNVTMADDSTGTVAVEAQPINGTETTVELDGVTASLRGYRDSLSERDLETVARRVWATDEVRTHFDGFDAVEMSVRRDREFDADTDTFTPADTATVRVTPTDGRLPHAVAVVDLDAETVTVTRRLPELDGVGVTVTDGTDSLSAADRDLIADLVVSDDAASYTVQNQFDDPDELTATVTDATGDGPATVTVEVAPPAAETTSVSLTVDLETETITRSFVVSRNVTINDADDGFEISVAE
ncbi:hypothetical protein [Natrinema pallidum]|uniref:Uncharacterized protein n=1 Tax=Natrinema pallidum TaxID=69527 RepID=A0A4P9THA7_9EURY|nr:hypothetical protein [Natrinema pallidum]QCW04283.1 hypothetical protein FGF80_14050 [Natrinema pallidum]